MLNAYETIAPGVLYKNVITDNPRQSIHVLIANPDKVHIMLGVAHDICASAEKTTDLAKKHNAVAAINGSFFDFGCKNKMQNILIRIFDCLGCSTYKAFPVYTLQSKEDCYALSHLFTGAIGWNSSDQQPSFGIIKTRIVLTINEQVYEVGELNKPHPKKPTLYSDCYDCKTPPLSAPGDEIVIEGNQIKEILRSSSGKTDIPHNGWVYVLPKGYKNLTEAMQEGDFVSIQIIHDQREDTLSASSDIRFKEHILASTPLLIWNDHIMSQIYDSTSTFYTKQHPRSAVGVLKDGSWVFVVVDGRQKHSEGFTMLELAEYMKELGCTGALNLDGGGSSTMVIHDEVVNAPSGREYSLFRKERPLSNALLIMSYIKRMQSMN